MLWPVCEQVSQHVFSWILSNTHCICCNTSRRYSVAKIFYKPLLQTSFVANVLSVLQAQVFITNVFQWSSGNMLWKYNLIRFLSVYCCVWVFILRVIWMSQNFIVLFFIKSKPWMKTVEGVLDVTFRLQTFY